MEKFQEHFVLNSFNISLIKLEVLKFIIVTDNMNIKTLLAEKKINIQDNINFFLNLKYNMEEYNILNINKNNKFFNYTKINNNNILKYILKKCSCSKKLDTNNLYYNIYNNLFKINNVYNLIIKKNSLNVIVNYRDIVELYSMIYKDKIYLNNDIYIDLKKYYMNFSLYFLGEQKNINKEKSKNKKEKNLKNVYKIQNAIYLNNIDNINKLTRGDFLHFLK